MLSCYCVFGGVMLFGTSHSLEFCLSHEQSAFALFCNYEQDDL